MLPAIISQVSQDEVGNVGIAIHSQSGGVRRVPLMTASLNVDDDGNLGVFAADGMPGTGGLSEEQVQALIDVEIEKLLTTGGLTEAQIQALNTEPLDHNTINQILQETGFPTQTLP